MNSSIIRFVLGNVLKTEAALLLLPCLVALIYREQVGIWYLPVAAACFLLGCLMTIKKPANHVFYLKEGCITTALSWIFLSFFGCLPFYLTKEIPSLTDALFETISGFTTTGASILNDVEALSHCSLFWRSFTHWIGGMGVLVFLLAIVPLSGGSNINLMRAESPGPSVGKLVPKVRYTARFLYLIYLGLTIAEMVLLLFGRMPLFDAICTSVGTAGTGGFGIKNSSIAGYSPYIQWIVTIFMILFGINFNAYYLILFGQIKKALKMEEVRYYLLIIAASVAFIFFNILNLCANAFEALTQSAFQVASIITTTGFSTVDFNMWNESCKIVLVLLMFIGACAGSTGGGIKVSRFVILFKTVRKEFMSYIHPKSIKKIQMDEKPIEHEVVRTVNVYFITFFVLFVLSVFLISFDDTDLITGFTAVAATINNIGPGLEMVGPSANFAFFSPFAKYVLMFDMLAGRLELFPLLLLFHKSIWKDLFAYKKSVRSFKKLNS
ncbi:MAG: TrkH family potassium uptake protein [Lachnospiraceae bacterium]|nr:TrkH family potassium uptake protein [Lachnospiraceae bacterium]